MQAAHSEANDLLAAAQPRSSETNDLTVHAGATVMRPETIRPRRSASHCSIECSETVLRGLLRHFVTNCNKLLQLPVAVSCVQPVVCQRLQSPLLTHELHEFSCVRRTNAKVSSKNFVLLSLQYRLWKLIDLCYSRVTSPQRIGAAGVGLVVPLGN